MTAAPRPTPSVTAAHDAIVYPDRSVIGDLKARAHASDKGASRLLLHGDPAAPLHEMLIVLCRDTIYPPHRNDKSAKSYTMLEGAMACATYSEDGDLAEIYTLAAGTGADHRLLRLNDCHWHTLVPLTAQAVFIETILGPHTGTQFADWHPTDPKAVADIARSLRQSCLRAARRQEPDLNWDEPAPPGT